MQVLIVDDSSLVRGYVRVVLEARGVACAEASHGQEALDLLRGVTGFDLMLVDVNMPVLDGYACVSAVRTMRREGSIKILMMTAGGTEFESRAGACGADGVLVKPFLADALWMRIHELGVTTGVRTVAA